MGIIKNKVDNFLNEQVKKNSARYEKTGPNFEIAKKSLKIVKYLGNNHTEKDYSLRGGRSHTVYHYGTSGLAMEATEGFFSPYAPGQLDYGTYHTNGGRINLIFNDRKVYEATHYIGRSGNLCGTVSTYVPGVWEKMINILYSDALKAESNNNWLQSSISQQEEILSNISAILAYTKKNSVTINGVTISTMLERGQMQGADYSRTISYSIRYQDKQVFHYKVDKPNNGCEVYIPGDWEQIISNAIPSLAVEAEKEQEAKDMDSVKGFLRIRSLFKDTQD